MRGQNGVHMQMTAVAALCRAGRDPDGADQVDWHKDFVVGSIVDASVHEQKDYGLVFDFAAHADVLGLAAKHQVSVCLPIHSPLTSCFLAWSLARSLARSLTHTHSLTHWCFSPFYAISYVCTHACHCLLVHSTLLSRKILAG